MKAQWNDQCLLKCFLSMTHSWVPALVRKICEGKESTFFPNCVCGEHIIMKFWLFFLVCVFQFLVGLNAMIGLILNFLYQVMPLDWDCSLNNVLSVYIPSTPKKDLALFLKKVTSLVPSLHVVDVDVPLNSLCKDDQKLAQVALGREFHISLGRTVPIRVHQIDSVVAMLRQKLQFQRRSDYLFSYMNFTVVVKLDITSFHINTIFLGGRYLIDFSKWEVFVNDDHTRTFLSMEVITGGLAEVC